MKVETFQAEEAAKILQWEGRGQCGWSRVRWNRGNVRHVHSRDEVQGLRAPGSLSSPY